MAASLVFLLATLKYSSAIENLPHDHIKHVMLHYYFLNTTAFGTCSTIRELYGRNVTSPASCYRWYEKFKAGDISLNEERGHHEHHHLNHSILSDLIRNNPRLSAREYANMLNTSHSTVLRHLHSLGFQHKFGKLLPHELNDWQKGQRMSISQSLLSRYERKSFLPHLVTGDEKYVVYVNLKRKRQWVEPGRTPSADVNPESHQRKVMVSVWWDMKGVIYFEVLPENTILNSALYTQQLDKLANQIGKTRPLLKDVILQHDNAKPHTAKLTRDKLSALGWEILSHPPYSPDLAPSDYHLFHSMESALAGKHFTNEEDVEVWLRDFFASKPRSFYEEGIRLLPIKWGKVIDNDGNYID